MFTTGEYLIFFGCIAIIVFLANLNRVSRLLAGSEKKSPNSEDS